jgi:oligopeptide/dipeptide ABC transporter ATP-binding protein
MHHGKIVEHGTVRAVLKNPQHPYTRALLDALPSRRARVARVKRGHRRCSPCAG